jgi:hypothetical protein
MAEENVLPSSGGAALEKTGIKDNGYLTKKGTPSGESAKFNKLPPGMDIEDQSVCDIRAMPMKTVVNLGYPGDGWT